MPSLKGGEDEPMDAIGLNPEVIEAYRKIIELAEVDPNAGSYEEEDEAKDSMGDKEPLLDSAVLSRWEFVARSVLMKFPGASLEVQEVQTDKAFEIIFQGECLLILDKRGVRYFFPSRRKRSVYWEKTNTNALLRVIFYILRDLAEANYTVLSITDKPISKRPVHISRYTRCPECKQSGGIRAVAREDSSLLEAPDLYTPIAVSPETKGTELKCTLCGWLGVREELARKRRGKAKP